MDILRLHFRNGCGFYSQNLIESFVGAANERFENKLMSKTHHRFLLKTASYLKEYNETSKIRFGRKTVKPVSEYYDRLLESIHLYNGWTPKIQHHRYEVAKTFFKWLKSKGHETLQELDEAAVKEHLIDCASRLSGSSIDTVSRALKATLLFLYDSDHVKNRFGRLFSFTFPLSAE